MKLVNFWKTSFVGFDALGGVLKTREAFVDWVAFVQNRLDGFSKSLASTENFSEWISEFISFFNGKTKMQTIGDTFQNFFTGQTVASSTEIKFEGFEDFFANGNPASSEIYFENFEDWTL